MPFCKPRVGDIVHFISSTYAGAPHAAAVILAVTDERECRLKIFGDERDTVAYARVHGAEPGTWHYREECDQ